MSKLLVAPTKNAIQKTLAAQLLNTAGVGDPITFDDVDGIPNLPGVLVINRVDSSGAATASKREYIEYSGTSGNTVLITTRNVDNSNAALTHAVGSIVEFIPSVTWADRIYDALSVVTDVDDVTAVNTTNVVTPTDTQTLTNKTLTDPIINSISGASLSGTFINSSRITKRVTTITSHATPTVNTDNCDVVTITAQAEDITSMTTNLSGTPTNFQTLVYRILDNGSARAITWGASFQAMGVALPTTTTASKVLTVGFIYDTVDSKWGCVASVEEA